MAQRKSAPRKKPAAPNRKNASPLAFRNPKLPTEKRVRDLLSRMGILGYAVFDRDALLVEYSVGGGMGTNGSAAVGDDCRRCGLLGVEELSSRNGIYVRRYPVCLKSWAGLGWVD